MIEVTTTMNAKQLDAALERIARAGLRIGVEADSNGNVKSVTLYDREGIERIEIGTTYGTMNVRARDLEKSKRFVVKIDEKSLTGRRLMRAEAITVHVLEVETQSDAHDWARQFVKDICPEETSQQPYSVTEVYTEKTALGLHTLSSEEVSAAKGVDQDMLF